MHIENKIDMYLNTYTLNKVWFIKICCRMIPPLQNSYCYFPGSCVSRLWFFPSFLLEQMLVPLVPLEELLIKSLILS